MAVDDAGHGMDEEASCEGVIVPWQEEAYVYSHCGLVDNADLPW